MPDPTRAVMKYRSDTELLPGVTEYPAAKPPGTGTNTDVRLRHSHLRGFAFFAWRLSDYGFAHLAQRERACATLERCFCDVPSCSINDRASMRNTPALAPRLRFRVISRAARPLATRGIGRSPKNRVYLSIASR